MGQSEHPSHNLVTVRRRRRAIAVRMGMLYGLDDRSALRRLDEHRRPISLHLRGGCRRSAIGSIGDRLGLGLGFVIAGRRRYRRWSSSRRRRLGVLHQRGCRVVRLIGLDR